jgi:carbonic anhydrase/acetyltransferase-like protein (isoleucine patch superfamily)
MSQPRGLVLTVGGKTPVIAEDVFLAPGCIVAGDVVIEAGSSVWFNAVIRGDVAPIRIGQRTNIQDGAVLHIDPDAPCIVGNDVTIGHSAIVHGTTVGDGVTIAMGAIVLSRSKIGAGAVVAAGAVVSEGQEVAPGALVMGIPAKERRILTDEQQAFFGRVAGHYQRNAALFAETLTEVETELTRAG